MATTPDASTDASPDASAGSDDEQREPEPLAAMATVTQRELGWEQLVVEAERLGRDERFRGLSDEQVADRLARGASELAAATCRWLELLAEFVVRGTWADEGARSPGAWLSWKLGIGASTAREHVRVALRLRELPQVRTRFAAGTLSYSKVRAVTRLAVDASYEPLLLEWADHATAAELERIASRARSARRAQLGAEDPDDRRYAWTRRMHADGSTSLTLRAPDEVIAALEVDVQRLAEQMLADRLRGELPGGAEAPVATQDQVAGEAADEDAQATAAPGPDGTGTPNPGPAEMVEALQLSCAAAAGTTEKVDSSGLDRHTLVLTADVHDLAEPPAEAGRSAARPTQPVRARDDHGRVRGMPRSTLRRLACDAGIVLAATDQRGAPLDVGRRTRRPSAALRRAVQLRDGGCTFPSCHATRHLHVHHVRHWADGGETTLRNLVTVCSFHHRFVHERGWTIQVSDDGQHTFAAPDARPVPQVGRLPAVPDHPADVGGRGGASAEALLPPGHVGVGYDLSLAVAVLHQAWADSQAELAA